MIWLDPVTRNSVTPMAPAVCQPCLMECRDAEVLSLFAAIINKLKDRMQQEVPKIFEAVFQVTLQMITKDFSVSPPYCQAYVTCLVSCAPGEEGGWSGWGAESVTNSTSWQDALHAGVDVRTTYVPPVPMQKEACAMSRFACTYKAACLLCSKSAHLTMSLMLQR